MRAFALAPLAAAALLLLSAPSVTASDPECPWQYDVRVGIGPVLVCVDLDHGPYATSGPVKVEAEEGVTVAAR